MPIPSYPRRLLLRLRSQLQTTWECARIFYPYGNSYTSEVLVSSVRGIQAYACQVAAPSTGGTLCAASLYDSISLCIIHRLVALISNISYPGALHHSGIPGHYTPIYLPIWPIVLRSITLIILPPVGSESDSMKVEL